MYEPALKCKNNVAKFTQNFTLKLLTTFKMVQFLLFQLRGKSRFSRFPQKMFHNIDYWSKQPQHRQIDICVEDVCGALLHSQPMSQKVDEPNLFYLLNCSSQFFASSGSSMSSFKFFVSSNNKSSAAQSDEKNLTQKHFWLEKPFDLKTL